MRKGKAITLGKNILYSENLEILRIGIADLWRAWDFFKQYNERKLSFTDYTSIVLIKKYDIHQIASFDSDFDGIVQRVI